MQPSYFRQQLEASGRNSRMCEKSKKWQEKLSSPSVLWVLYSESAIKLQRTKKPGFVQRKAPLVICFRVDVVVIVCILF